MATKNDVVCLKPNKDRHGRSVRASGPSKLELIGTGILVLWLVHNFVVFFPVYGIGGFIGGTIADPRVWMLVVGLWLMHYRRQRATPKGK